MPAYQLLKSNNPRQEFHNFVVYFLSLATAIIMRQQQNLQPIPPAMLNQPLIPEELEASFRDAWSACLEREEKALHHAIDTVDIEQLTNHGLVASELNAKLSAVANVSRRLFANPIRGMLAKLLGLIDVVLESLGSATLAGAGLIELKKAIEKLID